jgi:hypothetical protein
LCLTFLVLTSACAPAAPTESLPQPTEISPDDLKISLLYPTTTTDFEMGRSIKSIIQISDAQGNVVPDAQVTWSLADPGGQQIVQMPAIFGEGNVYRTDSWTIPHKTTSGDWSLRVEAQSDSHQGSYTQTLRVKDSINEVLLHKYGFWIDSPTLRGIVPSLVKEQGDAHNGSIILGGQIPAQHVFPENWVDVEWREGDFKLANEEDVRKFILETLGVPGFYPMRDLKSFERTTFKSWDAWLVKTRSKLTRYDEQWMIFYAPEVDKTYAIGTLVVAMPVGIEHHSYLRESFEVHPEIQANGTAPAPLEDLLPPVELISPAIGTTYFGPDEPIVLTWEPAKELAQDEYYQVQVDFDYVETTNHRRYVTRDTQLTLPVELYSTPNCSAFSWQVTLMKQNGTDADGQPTGEAISFPSLYWYVLWYYPPGVQAPFDPRCPNELY